jgi:eukaryotic translation initiation factor 2C
LRGVRVETTHQEGKKSMYKITGITSDPLVQLKYMLLIFSHFPASSMLYSFAPVVANYLFSLVVFSFPLDEGTQMTVVQYFWDRYKYRLKFTSWPCLQSGSDARPIYLPMEVFALELCTKPKVSIGISPKPHF